MHIDRCTLAGVLACFIVGSGPAAGASAPSGRTSVAGGATAAEEQEPRFGASLELDELVAAVLARNAELGAMEAALRAARARAERATALDDPTARLMVAPLSIGSSADLGYELQASQRIPFPGKRRLRGEVASSEASAAAAQLEATRLELAARAASLYADYYLNARELEINAEHVKLLGSLKDVATARYAAGLVPQQAPLQAEVEASRMLHHEAELRANGREIVAQLDALLHRRPDAALPPPPTSLPTMLTAASVHAGHGAAETEPETPLDGEGRPELRAQVAVVEARQGELELARRARQPDFEAMAGYSSMWDTPEHRFTVGVGINLPIRRAPIRAEVAEAQARFEQAQGELEQLTDTFRAEAFAAAAHREEMGHLVELYRDRVIPAARDQVAAARASFESGQESMLGLIEAERSLRDAQQQYDQAVAGLLKAQATLARTRGELAGMQLPAERPPAER